MALPRTDSEPKKTVGKPAPDRNALERLEELNEFVRQLTPPGPKVDDDFVRKTVGRPRPR